MSSTRHLAVAALHKILVKGIKPKEALDELSVDIDQRERAFLMELVYGVLRYRDYLDWMLRGFLEKPSGIPFHTLNNLRIAVYQIRYLRVPEWAAVNEAVDIEKMHKGKASLVNAVLRNFLRNKEAIAPPAHDDPVGYLSITTSHPKWLVKRWIRRFGYDEASGLLEKNNEMPPLVIRVGRGQERERAVQALAGSGTAARPTVYSPSGIVIGRGHTFREVVEVLPSAVAQDEASQLVVYLLNPSAGERVLDACAAPGGKTSHIADMMQDRGEVVAVESENRKIVRLEENISRLGLKSVRIVHGDVKNLDKTGCCLFDRILLDAPCSALGVIRRNPDVKYRHGERDLARFKEGQLAMLRSASRFLKPGGSMVYSVCSTEPEEGEEVIREFLQDSRDFSIIKGDYDFLRPFETGGPGQVFYRTFPHRHGMDGFFAARLKKG